MFVRPTKLGGMSRRKKLHWPYGPIPTTFATAELLPENTARGIGVMLLLDDAESSYLEMNQPEHLMFEYMQYMQCAIQLAMETFNYHRFLHLGGAGCALPRALHAQYPDTQHLAIEYDPLLAEYVRDWFDLPRSPALRIRVSDAREALETMRPDSQDVITRDVFAQRLVPHHTRTFEFFQLAHQALRDHGIFLINTGSRPRQEEFRQEVAALLEVFPHVYAIAEPVVIKGRRPGNVVLIASKQPVFDALTLDRHLRRLPITPVMWNRARLTDWASSARPFRDAPVESRS